MKNNFSSTRFRQLMVVTLLLIAGFVNGQWKEQTTGGSIGYRNAVRYNATGDLYTVLQDASNGYKVTVQKQNGASWSIVGTAGFSTYNVYEPTIAVNQANGDVYVAYIENTSGSLYKLSCNKFNGTSWVEVGTPEFLSTGPTGKPGMTIDNNGNPVIVTPFWGGFYVYQYSGAIWNNLTTGATQSYVSTTPLDIVYTWGDHGAESKNNYFPFADSNGDIYIAVSSAGTIINGVSVFKYSAGTWTKLGSNLPGGSYGAFQRVVKAPDGTLYVAYSQTSTYNSICKIYVHKWNGTSWADITNGGTQIFNSTYSNFNNFSFDIAFDSNSIPYVLYQNTGIDFRAYVKKYNPSITNWDIARSGQVGGFYAEEGLRLFIDNAGLPYYVGTTTGSEPRVYVIENKPIFNTTSFLPATGPAGTTVYIYGGNFTGTTDVSFNGTAAAFTTNSNTTITATVPANAATGPISVTNAAGTSSTSYSYTVPPINGSIAFTGTNQYTATTVLAPGTTSTTYEMWFRQSNNTPGTQGLLQTRTGTIGGDGIDVSVVNGSITVSISGSFLLQGVGTVNPNTWYHLAVVRNGTTTWTVYLNGSSIGTFSFSDTTSTDLSLGRKSATGYDEFFIGNISNFRYVKGTAVYTANFTPPTAALTAISGTQLLMNTYTGAGFLNDNSGNNYTTTNGNSVTSSTYEPFTPTPYPVPMITSFTPTTGPIASTVTIIGTNFNGTTAVKFNGTAATSFTVNSATSITATVPTGATTGAIAVTTAGGTVTSSSNYIVSGQLIAEYQFNNSLAASTGAFGNSTFGSTAATLNVTNICTDALSSIANSLLIPNISSLNTASFQVDLDINVTTLPASTGTIFLLNTSNRACALYLNSTGALSLSGRLTNGQLFSTQRTASLITTGTNYKISVQVVANSIRVTLDNSLVLVHNLASGIDLTTKDFSLGDHIAGNLPLAMCIDNFRIINSPNQFAFTEQITFTPSTFSNFTTCVNSPSTTQTFSVAGTNLLNDVVITSDLSSVVEISLDGTTYTTSLTLPITAGTVNATTVYLRMKSVSTADAYTGSNSRNLFISSGPSANPLFRLSSPLSLQSNAIPTISGTNSIAIGGTTTLTGSATAAASTPWVSSNTSVANVSSSGVVTGAAQGTTTITYTNTLGCQATYTITVVPAPTITSFTPTSGGIGSIITVTGTNFTGATAVTINGTAATNITVNSATELIATVPSGTTTGNIVVTAPGGTATSSSSFTVIPAPTITSFSPTSGGIGSTVTITGTNLTAATSVSFNGTAATNFTVNSATQITATISSGATTGTITVTTAGGTVTSSTSLSIIVPPPTITSFAPTSGVVGSSVTITGTGFSATAANNIVYFGSVKATVTAASTTSLTVTVPKSSVYAPITVISSSLLVKSKDYFRVVNIPIGPNSITNEKFGSNIAISSTTGYNFGFKDMYIAAGDFDNDGKVDVVKGGNGSVKVHRNLMTTPTTISSSSFDAGTNLTVTGRPSSVIIEDINSDGKLDIITGSSAGVSILINTSTGTGIISFANAINLAGSYADVLRAADFDLDGKLDLVTIRSASVAIYRNISTSSFALDVAQIVNIPTLTSCLGLGVGDFNKDSKTDIVVSNSSSTAILLNGSSVANITFPNNVILTGGGSSIAVADFDNDNDPDMYLTNRIIVNNYSSGSISSTNFTSFTYSNDGGSSAYSLSDLNGDGKLEVIGGTTWDACYLMIINTLPISSSSLSGIGYFLSKTYGYTAGEGLGVDVDGDNKVDYISAANYADIFSVTQNLMTPQPVINVSNNTLNTITNCKTPRVIADHSQLSTNITITKDDIIYVQNGNPRFVYYNTADGKYYGNWIYAANQTPINSTSATSLNDFLTSNPGVQVLASSFPNSSFEILNFNQSAGEVETIAYLRYFEEFTLSGLYLSTNPMTVTPPANFQVSTNQTTWIGTTTTPTAITLTPSSGSVASTVIYVRTTPSIAANSYSGNITIATSGATSVTKSVAATIYAPTAIGTQPVATKTLCINASSGNTINVAATGSSLTYQWYSNTSNSNTGGTSLGTTSGAQTATLTVSTATAGSVYYYCVVSGSCGTVTSSVSAVTINPVTVAGTASAISTNICSGTTASLSLSGNTGTIQWQSSANNSTWTNITGETAVSLTTPALTATTYYRAVVTSGVCSAANSNVVTISTIAIATVPAITGSSALCLGSSTTLSNTQSGGTWSSLTPAVATIDSTGLVNALAAGTSVISYNTVDGNNCPAAANITVTIANIPTAPSTLSASPTTVCAGATVNLNATTAASGVNWYTASTGGTAIGSSLSGANYSVTAASNTPNYYAESYNTVIVGTQTINYTGAITTFTVPSGVTKMTIDTRGASGGNTGGKTGGNGARMVGDFTVTPGQVLKVLVGGSGSTGTYAAGGGGGTFVTDNTNNPLCIAGGGGGAQSSAGVNGNPGLTTTTGGGYNGGTTGNGGGQQYASGGGGLLTNGAASGNGGPGLSFLNGGAGGAGCASAGAGGFGGGSGGEWCYVGSAGSGGGYSGGGGTNGGGNGGGSFNNGTNQSNTQGFNSGNGSVILSWNVGSCPSTSRTQLPITVNESIAGTAAAVSTAICTGTTASLSLTSSSGAIQWQSSPNNSTWTNISGATAASYTTPALTTTTYYRAVVTSGSCTPANSNVLTITISNNQPFGNALALNGTGKIQFASQAQSAVGANFTVEAWVNVPSSATNIQTILSNSAGIGQGAGFRFGINRWNTNNGFMVFEGGSTFIESPVGITKNVWQHVAVVVNGSVISFYINGVLVGTATGSFPALSSTVLTLGSFSDNQYLFNGSMDEVRLWNVSKTQQEILASMYTPLSGTESSLVAYFNFNQGTPGGTNTGIANLIDNGPNAFSASLSEITRTGTAENFVQNTNVMAITGSVACVGSSVQLNHPQAGGTWSSATAAVATVNSAGLVSCLTTGTSVISYLYTYNNCQYTDTYTLTVNATPVAPTVANTSIAYCQNATAAVLTATAAANHTLRWYTVATGGTGSTTAITPITTTSGTFTFYVAQVNTSGCEGPRVAITVTVSPATVVGTATTTATNICPGNTVTLSLSGNTGTIQWQQSSTINGAYTNITGATSASFTTSALSTTTFFRAEVKSGGCAAINSNVITVTVPPAPYPYDRAVNFTNGGSLVRQTTTSLSFTNFTVEAWIYPTTFNNWAGIVSKGAFQLMTTNTGTLAILFEDGWSWSWTQTPNVVLSLNRWQHVAASYNASTKETKLYVDGSLVHTWIRTQNYVPNFSASALAIGLNNGTGNQPSSPYQRNFIGHIDEVKAWNTVRTDAQILANFATELAGNETGLVAYYKFDQGVGGSNNTAITSLTDLTSNANHLTPNSMTMNGTTNNILQVGPAIINSPGICLNDTVNLTHTFTGGTWATSNATIISVDTNTGAAVANAEGTATITYTFTDNSCTFSTTKIFTVHPLPAAPVATSTVNLCQGITATALTATAITGNTLQWYTLQNGGTASTAATIPSTSTLGQSIFYVSQRNNATSCEGPRTAITVNVNEIPTITGAQNMTVGGSTLQLTGSGTPDATTPWSSSNTAIATVSSTGVVTAVAGGNITITYTVTNGCSITATIRVVDCNQPFGNALAFGIGTTAANADYIQVNSRIFPSQTVANFTIETWIKPSASDIITGTPGNSWLAFLGYSGTKRSPSLYITNNGVLHASWSEGSTLNGTPVSATSTTSLTQNKWTHVALVKDGTTMRLFVDGVQLHATTCLATLDIPDNAYWMGKSDQQFSGALDEVRFWSTARTQSQLKSSMYTELVGNESGLLTYFDFNEGVAGGTNTSISTINNKSNIALIGTLTNFTRTGTTSNFVGNSTANIDITGAATICGNSTSQYTHPVAGGTWSVSNGATATVSNTGLLTCTSNESITLSYNYNINGCSFTATKAIVIDSPAAPVTNTTINLCQGATTTALIATALTGHTLQWYTAATGGTASTTAPSPSTAALTTLNYFVSQKNNTTNCESSRTAITVTINAVPTITGAQSINVGGLPLQLTGSGTPDATTPWTSSNTAAATISASGEVTAVAAGSTIITYKTTSGCTVTAVISVVDCSQPFGNALQFDGVDDSFSTASNLSVLNITNNVTIETWIKFDQVHSDWVRLIGKGDNINRNYGLWLATNGKLLFQMYGGTALGLESTTALQAGVWYHIAAIKNGNTAKIYINGIEDATISTTVNPQINTLPLTVGYGYLHTWLKGALDEVRVWNVARSLSQIQQGMYNALVGNETGLVAYYDFNQGIAGGNNTSIISVLDRTTNVLHGTLTNFAKTETASNFVGNTAANFAITGAASLCANSTSQYTHQVSGGTWSVSSGASATISATGLLTAAANEDITVSYTYIVNGCSFTATKAISINTPAAPVALATVNLCQGVTASALTATATTGNTLQWYTVATLGTASTTAPTPSTATLTTLNYFVSQKNNTTNCESLRTAITVIINAIPTITGVQNMTVGGATLQLTGSGTPDTTTPWASSNSSVATISATGEVTAVAGGTTTITYITASGCTKTATLRVTDCAAPFGNALSFDGVDDISVVDNVGTNSNFAFGGTTSFSLETWVKRENTGGLAMIFSKYHGGTAGNYSIGISAAGKPIFFREVAPWSVEAPEVLPVNEWHHLAATYDGSQMRIYVDGVLKNSIASGAVANNVSNIKVHIGGAIHQVNTPIYLYKGELDEIRVWNVARTATQIQQAYTTTLQGNETGLVAYYDFNQGVPAGNNTSINSIINTVNSASNGTFTNFAKIGTTSNFVGSSITNLAIAGLDTVCANSTSQFTHPISGGTWSVSNGVNANISASGLLTSLGAENITITYLYTVNGCSFTATKAVTIVAPAITAQSVTPAQNICINGVTASFSVTAIGSGITYQWYKNTTATNSGGTLISGATNSVFMPSNILVGTTYYYCVVSNTCSSPMTSSVSGAITVSPASVAGTISGTSSICSGTTSTLTLAGNVGTNQWQRFDNPIWTDLTGETNSTFTTPALTQSTTYRALVTSGLCTAVNTASFNITVNPLPVISGTTTVGIGDTITLVKTTTAATTNPWISSSPTVATISNTGVVSGLISGTTTITFTNNNGCTDTETITVITGTTQTPILTLPATNTTGATTLNFNYTLPETPLAGSVTLIFTPTAGGTPISWSMNNATSSVFSYVVGTNPTSIANVVSGTALGFTTYNVTIAYQDAFANPTATATNSNIQTLAPPAISFANANYNGVINVPISIPTVNTGGAMETYSILPNLPAGMTLDTATGLISGTPTVTLVQTTFTITATNAAGTDSETITLFIDLDTDGDGIGNANDPDIDGDGSANAQDTDPLNPCVGYNAATAPAQWQSLDCDNDGIANGSDVDVDGNGTNDNGTDTDGDGTNDTNDTDIDGDGIPNGNDSDPNGDGVVDNGPDTDGDGINDANDTDIDGDGIPNGSDSDPDGNGTINNGPDTDGDGINDANDTDIDGDGIPNGADGDANGDGIPDTGVVDTDGDGITDAADSDPNGDGIIENGPDTDGDGINNANDTDIDGDGIPNNADVDPDGDGINNNGTDNDHDGINDANDPDIDGDGIPNNADVDINGDGINDNGTDTDNDGINNTNDSDIDGDGVPNAADADPDGDGTMNNGPDTDGDGINDTADSDVNGDGIDDNGTDTDNDGINDANDTDIDGDGIPNGSDADPDGNGTINNGPDMDGDGINDAHDTDMDGDGIPNGADSDPDGNGTINNGLDTDGDGINDANDPDIDGDGIPNGTDGDANGDGITDTGVVDTDGDGITDAADSDPNGDGIIDNGPDTDGDGINDANDTDMDGDGIPNTSDADPDGNGTVNNGTDTDGDGINDANDPDIDGDGIPNAADADVNGDGIDDNGTDTDNDGINNSNDADIDGDGIPNVADADPDGDGTINNGPDTDGDGINDTADSDVNGDGVDDNGTDTDNDGINDANDPDLDGDGIPNGDDADPDGNGTINNGPDMDGDGINDANDTDMDGDGIPNGVDNCPNVVNPSITLQPNNQVVDVCPNTTPPTLTIQAVGEQLTYQWYSNTANSNIGGTILVGATNASYVPSNTLVGPRYYYVVINGTCGSEKSNVSGAITIQDLTLPTVLTQNFTAALNATGIASITAAQINNGSTDNCSIATVVVSPSNFTCANIGANTVTLTVTDVNGNVNTGTATVTVVDATLPTVVTQNISIILDAVGQGSITAAQINNGSTDNCGIATVTVSQLNFSCTNIGTNTVTLTVTDVNGNSNTGTAIVTVINNFVDTDGDGIKDNCDDDDDNDGESDVEEIQNGTDPLNPCSFKNIPSITSPAWSHWSMLDCDNDGLTNGEEIGPDPNNPFDPNNNTIPDYIDPNNHATSDDGLEIFNLVTPNGDGENDVFVIRNIGLYPENSVEVYNRWGSKVYSIDGYGQNQNYFRGVSEGKVTVGQDAELPVGTYWYVLNYKNTQGVWIQRVGYLYLNK